MKIFTHGDQKLVLAHVAWFGKFGTVDIHVEFEGASKGKRLCFENEQKRDAAFSRMEAEIESIV